MREELACEEVQDKFGSPGESSNLGRPTRIRLLFCFQQETNLLLDMLTAHGMVIVKSP